MGTLNPTHSLSRDPTVKVTRPINAETENAPYLPNWKVQGLTLDIWMEYDEPHHRRAQ